jgi:hypothetical protein
MVIGRRTSLRAPALRSSSSARVEGLAVATDDQLARAVVIGNLHGPPGLGLRLAAGSRDYIMFESENGSHRAGCGFAGFLHQLAAAPHQRQAIGKVEAAGRGQGRKLAEAVPGEVGWRGPP